MAWWMNWKATSSALCLMLVMLAGCADSTPAGKAEDADTTLATGAGQVVRGIVVDAAIRPVAGAEITLDETVSTTSDAAGAFRFEGVSIGAHRVRANATDHSPTVVEFFVEEGRTPGQLRIILPQASGFAPFVAAYQFDGRIECGVQVFNPSKGGCFPLLFGDVYWDRHDLPGGPDWVQTDMIWESTQTLGSHLWLQYDCISGDPCPTESVAIVAVSGESPLTLFMEPGLIEKWQIGNPQELSIRVFPGSDSELVMVIIEQDFTHFTHVFYNTRPIAGWNFIDDGAPPQ